MGPLSSGVLATVADSRWAFVPPVVLGLAVAVACWKLVTDSKAPEGRALDWPGQITIAVGLTALLWGIIEGGDRGWAARRSSVRWPSRRWPSPASSSPRPAPPHPCSTWTC
ncbi:hypothetical protein ACFXMT_01095 [Streptomyces mirabilis]|uniref:hypothetical protein n=1 Tax=Streptomyces mirabilis TaxID=68239 RepID=UPI0036CC9F2F